mgnify:CR=1 FL=1
MLRVFENKWYIDELYDRVIVQPITRLAGLLREWIEPRLIDGLVNGIGRSVQYTGRQIRFLQSGQIGSYILLMETITGLIRYLITIHYRLKLQRLNL